VATTVALREICADSCWRWQGRAAAARPAHCALTPTSRFDLGRPNGPVTEALLRQGVIVKPRRSPVSKISARVHRHRRDNARFVQALLAALEA
jgi:histidinol-phosphate aminotransferase